MSETFDFSALTSARAHHDRRVVLPFPLCESTGVTTASSERRLPNLHDAGTPSPLVKRLCEALTSQQVSYCHWKSNWRLNRWLTGEGDLDILVDRADAQKFATIIYSLGFKQAEPPADRRVPGILNFYGFDTDTSRFIHLHVHYQLVIGHDLTKNYHLPIETLYLEHSIRRGIISVPNVEFEFIVFVLRMVLKHSAIEALAHAATGRRPKNSAVEQELDELESRVDRVRAANILRHLAPSIDNNFFEQCVQSLRSGNSTWTRMRVRQELERRLKTCARYSHPADALLKVSRPAVRFVRERVFRQSPRKRFVDGGLLIAIVGGDGAGKTTTLNEIDGWLRKKFSLRRFHLGKPPRSIFTYALIVMLRLRRLITGASVHPERNVTNGQSSFPGYLQLLRWVCAGRDRSRVYTKARRFATNGGIALCDRYPLPNVRLMEGPNIARTVPPERRNRLIKKLMKAENNYYRSMMLPDVLIVLRVDPEIAVRRKTTETELHVRTRSTELWEQDWSATNAHVIDAGLPLAEVVSEAQAVIWSKL